MALDPQPADPSEPQISGDQHFDTSLVPLTEGLELSVRFLGDSVNETRRTGRRTGRWPRRKPSQDSRPLFLLVHGLASNAIMWDGVQLALRKLGSDSLAVDLRGHGLSSKPDSGFDFATVSGDLDLLISTLDIPAADLVVAGQSWGANVVLELAIKRPEIRGLVLVDGGYSVMREHFPTWESCKEALAPPVLTGFNGMDLEALIRKSHPDWPETGIQGTMGNFRVTEDGRISPWLSRDSHMLILHELWKHDPLERIKQVQVPVLYAPAENPGTGAWGDSRREALDRCLSAAPNARVHWFSPSDHDIHAQHPDELAAEMMDAVSSGFFSERSQ